jgi:hypothetical protein
LALILSTIGVVRDQRRLYAIVMLLVSAAFLILVLRSYGIPHSAVPAFHPGISAGH